MIPPADSPRVPSEDEPGPMFHDRRRRRSPWVPVVALGLSAVVHLVVILLYSTFAWRFQPADLGKVQGAAGDFEATQVVRLVELTEPRAEQPVVEEEEPEPEEEPAEEPRPGPDFPEAGAEEPEDGPTAAERLRPREGDPRLWAPLDPDRTALTPEERAELRIRGKLEAWNDSVDARALARARALDWTTTDEDGNRWGISPGRIHLGKFSLPLPFSFGAGGAGNRLETDRRQWEWEDIERGATTQEVRETLEERAKEIRERRDRERKEEADTTSGGR